MHGEAVAFTHGGLVSYPTSDDPATAGPERPRAWGPPAVKNGKGRQLPTAPPVCHSKDEGSNHRANVLSKENELPMRIRRLVAVALAAVGLLASVPAFAGPPAFPMPSAPFKQKVDARMVKARTHMERRAAKLSAAEAKELRARFDAGLAKVNEAVAKATADGTVTKDEAKEVRVQARAMKPGRGAHAHHRRDRRGKHGHHRKGGSDGKPVVPAK